VKMKPPGQTTEVNLVGVNFKPNVSLSTRYNSYLSSSKLTCPATLLFSSTSCVVVATGKEGSIDPLEALTGLSVRNGFTRCSGRMFAMEKLSVGMDTFYSELNALPENITIRTHAHPQSFSRNILDYIHLEEVFKKRNIISSPTSFSHLLVAVQLDNERVGWGLYSMEQYKETISRPGDGDRLPNFDLNFNRAELKIAEAMQLLSEEENKSLFKDNLLAVDVGAAPGGWTGFLANQKNNQVSVIAVDPANLDPEVHSLSNVVHLQHKAEVVSEEGGAVLSKVGEGLVGTDWKNKFRFLVCDANMDIRDTLRELVLPIAVFLAPGGVLVVTIKLGRRVGVERIARQVESAKNLLLEAGFKEQSIRVHWLFGNSKNERTIFAVKQ